MTKKFVIAILFITLTVTALAQQSDEQYCPGFRNTTSFNTGDTDFYSTARVGKRMHTSDTADTTTGYIIMSTCVFSPDIVGHENITDSALYSTCGSYYQQRCDRNIVNTFDFSHKRFVIIEQDSNGIDTLTSNNGNGLMRIPDGYETSIRLGDMYTCGTHWQPRNDRVVQDSLGSDTSWKAGNKFGSEALFYTMTVNRENALLMLNYAIVTRKFTHFPYQAGEFVIRIVAQNTDGTWAREPMNSNLCYKVSAPSFRGELPRPWTQGYNNGCNESFCYKPWTKVAISLNEYIGRKVRIEMYTSDCIYDADGLYAYISGDFQSMALQSKGCPKPASEAVDTVMAPPGLLRYDWYVSRNGPIEDIYDEEAINNASFRLVTSTLSNVFAPTIDCFVSDDGDTLVLQTLCCRMVSALDPDKPFGSKVYVNITNRKPIVQYERFVSCNLAAIFTNSSFNYANEELSDEGTQWVIYDDTLFNRPLDTLYGSVVHCQLPAIKWYGLKLTTYTADMQCGAQKYFTFKVDNGPSARLALSDRNLCLGENEVVSAQSTDADGMKLIINDSVVSNTTSNRLTYQFRPDEGTTIIGLVPYTTSGCTDTLTDTVRVISYNYLEIDPPNGYICPDSSATLTAINDTVCHWVSIPPDPGLDSLQGRQTITVWPDTTTRYILKAWTNSRCVIDQSELVEIVPIPVPTIKLENDYINFDFPAVSAEDVSPYRHHTHWTFSDGYTHDGFKVNRQLSDMMLGDSLDIYMQTCNIANCCADTSTTIYVKPFFHWFPNVFTPAADANNRFGIVTSLPLIGYELYIYNRQGQLMFHTTNSAEQWDGTCNGRPCPTGAYAYSYRVAFDNNDKTVFTGRGTVTLLR